MLTPGNKLLCQAQCDGFGASAKFSGLVTARLFLVSVTKTFSERTMIRERRGHCKSDDSTDRGIEKLFPGMLLEASGTLAEVSQPKEATSKETYVIDVSLLTSV
jgi:hypothetical protein